MRRQFRPCSDSRPRSERSACGQRGPCGGSRNGKCEVNPENPCAWIEIYNKLVELGQEEKISITREDKGYEKVAYPRTINIRGK